jgi:hypothetical protein
VPTVSTVPSLQYNTFFTTGRLRLAGFFNNLGRSWIYERDV